jgi:SNF2 family DNA or RNA helicase
MYQRHKEMLSLMEHQEKTVQLRLKTPRFYNASSPGTGKTITELAVWNRDETAKRLLVIAPKSILQAAWGNDIEKFIPTATYAIAWAGVAREKAFKSNAEIVITNHDAIKWLDKNPDMLADFTHLVVDEATAYKNRTSARSKAMRNRRTHFQNRCLMSGTPTPQSVTDIWHQMYIVDDGETFGKQFLAFQTQVCTPTPVPGVPGAVKWTDKPDAPMLVADRMKDVSVRFQLEDCVDIPPNVVQDMEVALPPKLMKLYKDFEENAILELEQGDIDAVSAGVLANKLLQLTSGRIYDSSGNAHTVHTERAELVTDLVQESGAAVVAFLWTHQRDQLVELAKSAGLRYGVIDGSVGHHARAQVVEDFQNGKLDVVYAHPQSAGHGLTLTRGNTTIWTSPTFNSEFYEQFNARIYRNGQKNKTRTIHIAAAGTYETEVYKKLQGKVNAMGNLLSVLKAHKR